MVLSMHGAQEVDENSAPELVHMVAGLANRAGLPIPRVYLMDNPQPNAFATGRNPAHAAVAVTTGLLHMLSRDELAGVIAHELAHIRNRDTLLMKITATIAGAISMLAQFGMFFGGGHRDSSNNSGLGVIGTLAMVILAPLAAMLVQMAISRTREYAADNMGAQISGIGTGLPRRWRKSTRPPIRSRIFRPNTTRRPRICSSSIRCPARAWTICSLRIRRPKIGSPLWKRLPPRWAPLALHLVPGRHARRQVPGAGILLGVRGRVWPRCDLFLDVFGLGWTSISKTLFAKPVNRSGFALWATYSRKAAAAH